MSRRLPDRPNLEHLKNQAKALLATLRERDPAAQLADALHAVAQEYGFVTWPALKGHVESLPTAALDPLAGVWRADLSRSTLHPASDVRSAIVDIVVDADRITFVHTTVDEAGRVERGTNVVHVDGEPHFGEGSRHALRARRAGPRVLEVFDLMDDRPAGAGTYEVSPDGTTLTVTSASGDQVILFVAG